MLWKCSTTALVILSVQLAMAFGQNSREILSILTHGKGKTSSRNNTVPNLFSSNDIEVDERYSTQQNNGINYPDSTNSAYSPSRNTGYVSNDNQYQGNTG